MKYPISCFQHARDPRPLRCEVTWAKLVERLSRAPVRADLQRWSDPNDRKRHLPAWSPATFAPGKHRGLASAQAVALLVLDIDDGDLADSEAPWERYQRVLHTTWRHSEETPKYRLIVPLARPVAAKLWPRAWAWVASQSPGIDGSCCDASRIYFLPARQTETSLFEAVESPGDLLDIDAEALPPTAAERPARPVVRPPPFRSPDPSAVQHEIARRLRDEPWVREQLAIQLGVQITGAGPDRRARRGTCPACGRNSAWWWIDPERASHARCDHANSCNWSGPLTELAQVAA